MKNKRNVFLTLALSAAVTFGAGLFALKPIQASAAITVDETTKTASEGFVMSAGASVRRVDTNGDEVNDQAGIRFETNVSEDFESYLSTTYAGATFEYGTLITAQNVLDKAGKTVIDMTVANKDALQCNNPTDEVEDGKFYGSVLYTSENGVDWENLTDAQKLAIYKTELVARSYVKITQGEKVSYIYAKAEDTARSMRGVANAAILDNDGDLLDGYIGEATRETSSFDYYNPDLNTGDIGVEELADGTYTAYVNAKLYGNVTVKDGAFALSNLSMAAGEHSVSLFDANANVYSTPFVYPTKVLTKAEDLAMFDLKNVYNTVATENWDGYYVLGNDIDASSYTHKSIGYTGKLEIYNKVGLTGTFNGLGHQITGLKFGGNATQYDGTANDDSKKTMDYSLFGVISGGTVKNVGIVGVTFDNIVGSKSERATLANQIRNKATIENVYIQMDGLAYGKGSFYSKPAGVASLIDDTTTMMNCIFDIGDDGTVAQYKLDGKLNAEFGAFTADAFAKTSDFESITDRKWTNVYVVSPLALSHGIKSTYYEWYGANLNKTDSETAATLYNYANVTQYLSHNDEAIATVNFEALGFTADKGWKLVEGGMPVWKGDALEVKESAYTVNLDKSKTKLSENDVEALFGYEAEVVSISSLDDKYSISYNAGEVAVSGAPDVWNGETFTAVFSDGKSNVTATVRLVTKVITSAEDLAVFCLDNTNYEGFTSDAASQVPTKSIDGYYVLGQDIDASKTTWTMPTQGYISNTYNSSMDSKGFQGTFDGCGYTISNLTFGGILTSREKDSNNYWKKNSYSLFGIIGTNAVVKNFALTNVQYVAKFNGSAETMATCSGLAYYISSGATVENVYVSVKGVIDGGNAQYCTFAAFAYAVSATAKLNNIVVDNGNVNDATLGYAKYGSFVGRKHSNDNSTEISVENWKNIYVIANNKPLYTGSGNSVLYAANEGQTGVDVVAGLYKYATVEDWEDADHVYDSFKNAYWNTKGDVPVWGN